MVSAPASCFIGTCVYIMVLPYPIMEICEEYSYFPYIKCQLHSENNDKTDRQG